MVLQLFNWSTTKTSVRPWAALAVEHTHTSTSRLPSYFIIFLPKYKSRLSDFIYVESVFEIESFCRKTACQQHRVATRPPVVWKFTFLTAWSCREPAVWQQSERGGKNRWIHAGLTTSNLSGSCFSLVRRGRAQSDFIICLSTEPRNPQAAVCTICFPAQNSHLKYKRAFFLSFAGTISTCRSTGVNNLMNNGCIPFSGFCRFPLLLNADSLSSFTGDPWVMSRVTISFFFFLYV